MHPTECLRVWRFRRAATYGLTAKPLPKRGGRGSQHFAKDSPSTVGNLIMVRSAGPSRGNGAPERRPNSDRVAAIDHGVRAKRRVSRMFLVQQLCRDIEVAVQHHPVIVRQRMPEHRRSTGAPDERRRPSTKWSAA